MKTLITGSSGLLGSALKELYEPWEQCYYLKDGRVFKNGGAEVDSNNILFDKIIHCAANSSQVYCEAYPNKIFEDNINLVQSIILRFARGQKPLFIFPSSIVVYGDSYYATEENKFIPSPTTLYGVSKLAAEHVVNYHTKSGLIRGFNFRLGALCGPKAKKGSVAHIISKLQNIELPKLELYGDYPGTIKPYTYVGDVARFFKKFTGVQQFQPVQPAYNLCVKDNISIDEIANIAMHQLNIYKEIVWLGDKSLYQGDNKILNINCDLSRLEFKWNPQFDTSEKVINYVCNMSRS